MYNLIFDFDGVLADSQATWNQAKKNVFGHSDEEIAAWSATYNSSPQHSRNHNLTADQLAATAQNMYSQVDEVNRIGFPLFEGFVEEVRQLPPARMAIVSSNTNRCVPQAAARTGLTFTHILCFEDSPSKEEKVEMICQSWGISVRDAYYITDTQTDVIELRGLMDPAKIIGCSWGYQGYYALTQVLPTEQVLETFSDIRRIFSSAPDRQPVPNLL